MEYEYLLNDNKIVDMDVDYEFRLSHKTTAAANNICSTMGENELSTLTTQRWLNRFKKGNFQLDDLPRSGRPMELDVDLLKKLIEEDPPLT